MPTVDCIVELPGERHRAHQAQATRRIGWALPGGFVDRGRAAARRLRARGARRDRAGGRPRPSSSSPTPTRRATPASTPSAPSTSAGPRATRRAPTTPRRPRPSPSTRCPTELVLRPRHHRGRLPDLQAHRQAPEDLSSSPWTPRNSRPEASSPRGALRAEPFDLVVIGGGITGAGIARDAALRGLKVALVEKLDFGAGTSSKSSKLIHGGLRYLEQAELGLVFESVNERKRLMKLARHLVRPLPVPGDQLQGRPALAGHPRRSACGSTTRCASSAATATTAPTGRRRRSSSSRQLRAARASTAASSITTASPTTRG